MFFSTLTRALVGQVSPSSLYAMVRIQVSRMAERMRDGEDSGIERVDGKIGNP